MRMQSQSLASLLSGLRIWRCCKLQLRSQIQLRSGIAVAVAVAGGYSSDSTPSLETSYAVGVALRRQKTKKNKNKIKEEEAEAEQDPILFERLLRGKCCVKGSSVISLLFPHNSLMNLVLSSCSFHRWRDQLGEDAPCQPPPQLMELGLKHGCLALRISFWPFHLAHLFIANRPLEKGLHFLRLVFDFSNRTVFRIPLFLLTRLFESMR